MKKLAVIAPIVIMYILGVLTVVLFGAICYPSDKNASNQAAITIEPVLVNEPSPTPTPTFSPTPIPTPIKIDPYVIANEVIDGKWGCGVERKQALLQAGHDAKEIQNLVNNIVSKKIKNRALSKTQSRGSSTKRNMIIKYIKEISNKYNIQSELIESVVWHESEYNPRAKTGDHLGLMQVNPKWHSGRAEKLGVKDFYDPYSNILLGVDYLSELLTEYKDPSLALMMYNMDNKKAKQLYKEGAITEYARNVLAMAEELKREANR